MTLAIAYWVMFVIALVLGIIASNPLPLSGENRLRVLAIIGIYVLFFLLGWGVFGKIIQG